MKKIKIITGSDTGNTEYVAKDIVKLIELRQTTGVEIEIQKVHNISYIFQVFGFGCI